MNLKRIGRRILSIGVVLGGFAAGMVTPASAQGSDIIITNPYDGVVWDGARRWGQYKAAHHTHSTYSDGSNQRRDMLVDKYNKNFNIVAMTDHDVLTGNWDAVPNPSTGNWNSIGLGVLNAEELARMNAGTFQSFQGRYRGVRPQINGMIGMGGSNEISAFDEPNGTASFGGHHINSFFADYRSDMVESAQRGQYPGRRSKENGMIGMGGSNEISAFNEPNGTASFGGHHLNSFFADFTSDMIPDVPQGQYARRRSKANGMIAMGGSNEISAFNEPNGTASFGGHHLNSFFADFTSDMIPDAPQGQYARRRSKDNGMIGMGGSNEWTASNEPAVNLVGGGTASFGGHHINTFFADLLPSQIPAGQRTLARIIQEAEALGGISHLNHPGRYTGGQNIVTRSSDANIIKRYVDLFVEYPSLVGMEIINKWDGESINDRILWDNILKETMSRSAPIPVWGFSNDDSHSLSGNGHAWNVMLMDPSDFNEAGVKTSMQTGAFYGVTRVERKYEINHTGTPGAPAQTTTTATQFSGGTDNARSINFLEQPVPSITEIEVDGTVITIDGENITQVDWVINGNGGILVVKSSKDDFTFDVSGNVYGSRYVRAVVVGDHGVAYTQPFGITNGEISLNPYAPVDWDTWGQYKAAHHTHSTYSDGSNRRRDMLFDKYNKDFDIVAMTDHDVLTTAWDVLPAPATGNWNSIGQGILTSAERIAINNGSWKPTGRTLANIIAQVESMGGLTHLNHPGRYTGGQSNAARSSDTAIVGRYVELFKEFNVNTLVGMEIINKWDGESVNDRILWDNILKQTMSLSTPRPVWGFSNDDSHSLSGNGHAWNVMLMAPASFNETGVKTSMQTGAFYGVTRVERKYEINHTGTPGAPAQTTTTATQFNGGTHNAMALGFLEQPVPSISSIGVSGTTITIAGDNIEKVEWVINGEDGIEIAKSSESDFTFNISGNANGSRYVRAVVIGDHGVAYTQPFGIDAAGAAITHNPYATVTWATTGQYKAAHHTHSTYSDGSNRRRDMLFDKYNKDFDIVAMTDHDVLTNGWDANPSPAGGNWNGIGTGNLTAAERIAINAGTWKPTGRTLANIIAKVEDLGGLTHLNHPGRYTGGQNNAARSSDTAIVGRYVELFREFNENTLVGMEIINKWDGESVNDRILWDNILKQTMSFTSPRPVWGFSNDDSHSLSGNGHAWNVMLMNGLTVDSAKIAMQKGLFYGVTRVERKYGINHTGTPGAPAQTTTTAAQYSGGTDNTRTLGFLDQPVPSITEIDVSGTTITIDGDNITQVDWVINGSDGIEVIKSSKTDFTFDISGNVKSSRYVRAVVVGDHGVAYTQPFGINAAGNAITLNPYEPISDWTTIGQYKAAHHTHSTYSDGSNTRKDMLIDKYNKDFDIVAMTDHDVLTTAWNVNPTPATGNWNSIGTGNLNTAELAAINAGTYKPAGRTMANIIAKVQELGGITHLNHPGRYTGGQNNEARSSDPIIVGRYVDLFVEYPSLVGMEIINKWDGESVNDRILWDNILKETMSRATPVPVWGFSNDDSHSLSGNGHAWNVMLMPALTESAVRTSMETGAFYGVTRVERKYNINSSGTPGAPAQTTAASAQYLGGNDNARALAFLEQPVPSIKSIVVEDGKINITGDNIKSVDWIINGNGGIQTAQTGSSLTFDVDGKANGSRYVRAVVIGDHGVAYTQPFGINAGGTEITSNPYASVSWAAAGQYKAAHHTHSTYSDGSNQRRDMLIDKYNKGFDIVAMTDHDVLTKEWTANPAPATGNWNSIGTGNLTVLELAAINAGTYHSFQGKYMGSRTDRNGMISMGQSNEWTASNEPAVDLVGGGTAPFGGHHINTFFANLPRSAIPSGQMTLANIIKGAQDLGGISHLNHPGRYTGGQTNAARSSDANIVERYVDLFTEYPSLVGMEIINKWDGESVNDRILWDNILMQTMPQGRAVYGFSNDDSHSLSGNGHAWNVMLMPELTQDATKTSMKNGAFYGVTRVERKYEINHNGTPGAPAQTTTTATQFSGGTDNARALSFLDQIVPSISNIVVNQANGTIAIAAADFNRIEWVADGEVIHTGSTLDINANLAKVNSYVRAVVVGEHGVAYTQPFGVSVNFSSRIAAAKALVEGAVYAAVAQNVLNTEAAAKLRVEEIIGGLALNGVNAAVVNRGFTAAVAGAGNGSYNFAVNLSMGTAAQQTTNELALVINSVVDNAAADNADIAAVKALIENAAYSALRSNVTNIAQARSAAQVVINGLSANGVNAVVVDGAFTAAAAGTVSNVNGTSGSYKFTVTLNKGAGTQQTTSELTLAINAVAYSPAQDNADIMMAKARIEGAVYAAAAQSEVNTRNAAKSAVEEIIDALELIGVNTAVNGDFIAAVAGTSANVNGINGVYKFTVTLGKGAGTPQVTNERTLIIIAEKYDGAGTSVLSSNRVIPGTESGKNAETSAAALSGEFTAGPNPVAKSSGMVNFFWQGKRIQSAALAIFDASGNLVTNKFSIKDNAAGTQERRNVGSWNLTDAKGRQVSEGAYLMKGVITVDGKKEKVSVMIGVR